MAAALLSAPTGSTAWQLRQQAQVLTREDSGSQYLEAQKHAERSAVVAGGNTIAQ